MYKDYNGNEDAKNDYYYIYDGIVHGYLDENGNSIELPILIKISRDSNTKKMYFKIDGGLFWQAYFLYKHYRSGFS